MTPSPKIIIIGAGLAGLTAAYRLQKKGYNVHVYESRNRPGGRVLTAKVGEEIEEIGGKNFFDGGDAIHSLALIHELGLEPLHSEMSFMPLYLNGTKATPFFEILKRFKNTEDLLSKMEKSASQAQNLQEVIDVIFKDPDLRLILTGVMRNYEGSEPINLDPTSFDVLHMLFTRFVEMMKEANQGKTPFFPWLTVKGGNAQLPLALSEKLKNKIHYGQSLTAFKLDDQKITLTFNGDHQIQANIVLFAIPCSVFKDIGFGPNTIPPETLHRIQKVQYATNAKILFSIPQDSLKNEVFISPTMVSWANEMHNVRTFYYGGEHGMFETKEAESLLEQGIEMMQMAYPNFTISSFVLDPAKDTQLATYKNGVFKSWSLDPYSRGSYSNRALGTAAWLNETETIRGEIVRMLFKPIQDKIFFAGEHTTTLETLGTLEGAIESGERMARLMDKIFSNDL